MDKRVLIDRVRNNSVNAGRFYVVTGKEFIHLMRLEFATDIELLVPRPTQRITSGDMWKERLVDKTKNRMLFHRDIRVVLVNETNEEGKAGYFIFHGWIFNDIHHDEVERLRNVFLGEKRTYQGVYKNNAYLCELATYEDVCKPFYVKLLPPTNADLQRGVWLLQWFP